MYLLLIFCWHAVFNLHYSMPHCMVLNCSNGWRKTKGTNITYHRVPSKHMKNVWLQKIRRDNARDVKHSFVCSEHFTPDSYVTSLAETLCGHKGRTTLHLSTLKIHLNVNLDYQVKGEVTLEKDTR